MEHKGKGVMYGIGGWPPATKDHQIAQDTDAENGGPAEGCVRDSASLALGYTIASPNSALLGGASFGRRIASPADKFDASSFSESLGMLM